MCIRDRLLAEADEYAEYRHRTQPTGACAGSIFKNPDGDYSCLLYTSDAADERSSVDLGGRRIIKKKNIYTH